MRRLHVALAVLAAVGIVACGKGGSSNGAAGGSAAATDGKMIQFVTTQDGSPMEIKPELFDTPAAKEFASTGKNPYIGNQEAMERGKKLFQMYSCTQCHGGDAQGQTGPSLHGPDFRYAKDATNKGMFETIWHGTNGGMGAKGKGLMDPTDPTNGLTPDEVLKIQAWVRSHGKTTGNE
ncbi:cytochrome c-L [Novimethylophilus kurashikiensis]|uniref:Cytochrome c-L n=1 Tax=Novimethylophilus kurashikiensis TaxID=1825523 RepID=A0A2R5FAP1_9PROT|nr:c-type cytochrome [Novimethylophilus kurashikiensis]GBG15302.1 cytochrome c-L [Novimethylophilus kurashikiensis]